MKKLLFLFLSLLLISCEGDIGPAGPMGPQGEPGQNTDWCVKSFTIDRSEWRLAGNPGALNSYFYVDKNIKELTKFVFNEGSVIAYFESNTGIKNGMPYVLHKGDKDSKGEFLWTQTYDFDFYVGGVRFYLTYSDFNTQITPDTETFHIVLMW